jgi:hypothetical protein
MNIMKKMNVVLFTMLAVLVIASCKKEDPATVVGFWSGTYDGTEPWHVLFRANGTVRVYDGADTATAGFAEGTYTVSDSVRTQYSYSVDNRYSTAAKMNDDATSMVGTYGYDTSTDDAGTFTLTK